MSGGDVTQISRVKSDVRLSAGGPVHFAIFLEDALLLLRRTKTSRLFMGVSGFIAFLALPIAYALSKMENITWTQFWPVATVFVLGGLGWTLAVVLDGREQRRLLREAKQGSGLKAPHLMVPLSCIRSAKAQLGTNGLDDNCWVLLPFDDGQLTLRFKDQIALSRFRNFARTALNDPTFGTQWEEQFPSLVSKEG
jgi:hypothetical protein